MFRVRFLNAHNVVCRFFSVSMPDHDGGVKRDLLLIGRNFRDDNGIQYLLKSADGRFELPLFGFRPRPRLVASGRHCLLLLEQVVQALFQPLRALTCDVVSCAELKLRAK
jgi:hypothetical protein